MFLFKFLCALVCLLRQLLHVDHHFRGRLWNAESTFSKCHHMHASSPCSTGVVPLSATWGRYRAPAWSFFQIFFKQSTWAALQSVMSLLTFIMHTLFILYPWCIQGKAALSPGVCDRASRCVSVCVRLFSWVETAAKSWLDSNCIAVFTLQTWVHSLSAALGCLFNVSLSWDKEKSFYRKVCNQRKSNYWR